MMSVLLILIHRFNAIPIKFQQDIFVDRDKLTLKFAWKGKGIKSIETALKKNIIGGITLNFNNYYKATIIKTEWY